jgi:glycosyltransferase involved in cell wall biosynthesis
VEVKVLKRCHKLIFNQLRLPWALRGCKADWYLFLAFPVPVLSFKKNMISTIHDICCWDCPETMNGMSKWYFRISHRVALKKCKKIITISQFSKQRIVTKLRYPEEDIILIYCGIEDKFSNAVYEKSEKKRIMDKYQLPEHYILSLSTLEPRKNISLLIEAYQHLVLEEDVRTPLILAGRRGWKMDTLLQDVDSRVQRQILFTGFVEDAELPLVYRNADFFVFPSQYEGFGIPPLEAMACGAPVLSSDAASLPEILGDACVYFESGNVSELSREMKKLLSVEDTEREEMSQKGQARAKLFSWKTEANKLLQLLR